LKAPTSIVNSNSSYQSGAAGSCHAYGRVHNAKEVEFWRRDLPVGKRLHFRIVFFYGTDGRPGCSLDSSSSLVHGICMVQQPKDENPIEFQNCSVVNMSRLQLLKVEDDCHRCSQFLANPILLP
jgi:hypothetical protein